MFRYRITAGSSYTPRQQQSDAPGRGLKAPIAQLTGTRLGDTIRVQTAAGPTRLPA